MWIPVFAVFSESADYNTRWQALEVRRDSGSGEDDDPREQYVWHPYYIDALATRFYDATTGGTQVQHYFTHDANFNVTAVVDTAGAVVERYHYTPYGELTVLNGGTPDSDGNEWTDDPDNKSDIANPFTFTGRRYDSESGLYYYRNRYYGAEVGRFVTRDPIGYLGSEWDLYEYVRSSPLTLTDPTGDIAPILIVWGIAIGFGAGAASGCSGKRPPPPGRPPAANPPPQQPPQQSPPNNDPPKRPDVSLPPVLPALGEPAAIAEMVTAENAGTYSIRKLERKWMDCVNRKGMDHRDCEKIRKLIDRVKKYQNMHGKK